MRCLDFGGCASRGSTGRGAAGSPSCSRAAGFSGTNCSFRPRPTSASSPTPRCSRSTSQLGSGRGAPMRRPGRISPGQRPRSFRRRPATCSRCVRPGARGVAQAHALGPRILHVTRLAEVDSRLHEVHPEVCFRAINEGRPLRYRKKSAGGALERIELLRRRGIELDLGATALAPLDDVVEPRPPPGLRAGSPPVLPSPSRIRPSWSMGAGWRCGTEASDGPAAAMPQPERRAEQGRFPDQAKIRSDFAGLEPGDGSRRLAGEQMTTSLSEVVAPPAWRPPRESTRSARTCKNRSGSAISRRCSSRRLPRRWRREVLTLSASRPNRGAHPLQLRLGPAEDGHAMDLAFLVDC